MGDDLESSGERSPDRDVSEGHGSRAVEVWIAAPPSLRTDVLAFDILLDGALDWLRPFAFDGVIEAGLCKYRPTLYGRASLSDVWLTGATNLVMLSGAVPAFASVLSDTQMGTDAFVQFQLTLPIVDGDEGDTMLHKLVVAVQGWVTAVGATAAFIFDDPFINHNPFFLDGRVPAIDDFQITSQVPKLNHWWAMRRYTRGPGWDTNNRAGSTIRRLPCTYFGSTGLSHGLLIGNGHVMIRTAASPRFTTRLCILIHARTALLPCQLALSHTSSSAVFPCSASRAPHHARN